MLLLIVGGLSFGGLFGLVLVVSQLLDNMSYPLAGLILGVVMTPPIYIFVQYVGAGLFPDGYSFFKSSKSHKS